MPMVPDEIRETMAPLDPTSPELRCGQFLATQSRVTTRQGLRSSSQQPNLPFKAQKHVIFVCFLYIFIGFESEAFS